MPAVVRIRRTGLEPLVPWLIAVIAISALYFGKSVLVPIILAGLLSFLLAPFARLLRRVGLPKTPAVISTVLLALACFGLISAVIVSQASALSKDAPAYAERIAEKGQRIRSEVGQRFAFLTRENNTGGSGHRNATNARRRGNAALPPPTASGALPVEVQEAPPSAMDELKTFALPALAPIETTLIVLIVTIFILFQKEDLRDRALRLMGVADLHRSTVALDDGAKRLSRYFLSQFAVNCGFGAIVWGSLLFLGIPAPGLWGILAGLLRFVPYVGPIIAAVGPLTLAAAVGPDWTLVIYVALLFVILEPLVGYVVEPLLYGHSTGLSPVSVVVAALFWTWIWGPVGLVLSMPLTLTLVVLGRHIPAFAVFDILLGDRPALSPVEIFYQRILAGQQSDAIDQAELLLETMPLSEYYDGVVLGALRLAAADVDRGAVARSTMHEICEATLEVVDALSDHIEGITEGEVEAQGGLVGRSVICIPGRGPLDAAVSAMAVQLLRRAGATVIDQSRDRLGGAGSIAFDPGGADTVCVLGLFDQRGAARILPLIKRLLGPYPGVAVLVGVQRSSGDAQQSTPANLISTVSAVAESVSAMIAGRVDQTI